MSHYTWLLPPVICGLLALLGNVVLGQQVLRRNIIFIDLAVAQVAALGAVISEYWIGSSHLFRDSWFGQMLGPWVLSLIFCGCIALMEKRYHKHLEPLIGSFFVVSASLAIIAVSQDPHGADFIQTILNGQLLWVGWNDVWPLAAVTFMMLGLIVKFPAMMAGKGFYFVFAILMPITVKLTGIYLEFALLVIPALCVANLNGKAFFLTSLTLGIFGIVTGLAVSAGFDLPSGASIVLTLFVTGMCFYPFFSAQAKPLRA
ncbi:metal ABC transporter permease [Photobacterium sp. SDRW27]|uniref:metal ABC transporter permease n=1 Tax=Photobacterium obscurum TaxID=2829490 RepID=UPI00224401BA|nr:metal ABC transporter permease [Photobacterium obscurum]MCW8328550.1 metal ABC transporter permease [Photobacterium obscurum]